MIFKTVLILLAILFQTTNAQETKLLPFKMEDQFKQEHTEKECMLQLSIIIGSDRDGSKYNAGWGKAIADSMKSMGLEEDYKIFPLADLRGVPFFMKGFVRGKFPKEKEKWCLMDWKGYFAKNYNFVKGESNIAIFAQNGELLYLESGEEPDEVKLTAILESVKHELSKKQGVN